MRLIIHPGLHKTGSTYLQHVLNDHHAALAKRGIYYEWQEGYPAHHHAAWRVLQGDAEPIRAMAQRAAEKGCDTIIFSSEDLEGALYDERPLRAVDKARDIAGIDAVEWHVVLRDPAKVFQSLFAQLQHHIYYDGFQLFYDTMRRGFVHFAAPVPESGTPYWYYTFDPACDLARLHDWNCDPVIAHDFAAQDPFPGASLLEHLGVLDVIDKLPGDDARNARPKRDDIIRGYVARVSETVPSGEDQQRIVDGFLTCLESALDNVSTYAELIGEKYRTSHETALMLFGKEKDEGSREPSCSARPG
ncbi:hypothetical protein [Erythrobacter sp.]|jgi:hypothetical protein|uniref:hypothetical protein n=1 Tax=Erythrobacter sp. TaxID=1042 RepID=UPI002EB72497|nr:hypothetical protein [Erythrobacter sp.]